MFRIAYPYDPDELEAKHPPFVQDLIAMQEANQLEALMEIGKMIAALKQLGLKCGFTKKMFNSPLYELKTHSRGGQKGGARAYLFRSNNNFLICRAECKISNEPDPELLESAAYILLTFKSGRPVFPVWMKTQFKLLETTHEKP
jgi:hypothetical protein